MTGSIPDYDMDDCESGPYCKHWSDFGYCEECAVELLRDAGYTVIPPETKEKGSKP